MLKDLWGDSWSDEIHANELFHNAESLMNFELNDSQETFFNQQRGQILNYFILSCMLFIKQRVLHFLSEVCNLKIAYKFILIEMKILNMFLIQVIVLYRVEKI